MRFLELARPAAALLHRVRGLVSEDVQRAARIEVDAVARREAAGPQSGGGGAGMWAHIIELGEDVEERRAEAGAACGVQQMAPSLRSLKGPPHPTPTDSHDPFPPPRHLPTPDPLMGIQIAIGQGPIGSHPLVTPCASYCASKVFDRLAIGFTVNCG